MALVLEQTPRLLGDVVAEPVVTAGGARDGQDEGAHFELRRPGGATFRLNAAEYALVRRLDGERSLAALCEDSAASTPPLPPAMLLALLGQLQRAGMVENFVFAPLPDATAAAPKRSQKAAVATALAALEAEETALLAQPPVRGVAPPPSLGRTGLHNFGAALDPQELAALVVDALVQVRLQAYEVACDMLRNAASLAPHNEVVRDLLVAVTPLQGEVAAAKVAQAWRQCEALAPAWCGAAQEASAAAQAPPGEQKDNELTFSTAAELLEGEPRGAAPGPREARAAVPAANMRRRWRRAMAALVLVVGGAFGAAVWWLHYADALPEARLHTLTPMRHVLFEGGAASAVRPQRLLWFSAPAPGEVSYVVSPRTAVGAGADVVRLHAAPTTPTSPTPAMLAPLRAAEGRLAVRRRQLALLRQRRPGNTSRGGRRALLAWQQTFAASRAAQQRAQAEVDRLQAGLGATTPRAEAAQLRQVAPFAGTVTQVRVGLGQKVTAGTQLVEVVDRSSLYVRFMLPASAPSRAPGDKVLLAIDVGAPGERQARVRETKREGSRQVLELELDDPSLSLPVVLAAPSFRLVREVVAQACFIPKEALRCVQGHGCTIWQLVAGKAQPRRVRLVQALEDGAWVQWQAAPSGSEAPLIIGVRPLGLQALRAGMALTPSVY